MHYAPDSQLPGLQRLAPPRTSGGWRDALAACLFAVVAAPACAVLAVLVAACEGPEPEPLE